MKKQKTKSVKADPKKKHSIKKRSQKVPQSVKDRVQVKINTGYTFKDVRLHMSELKLSELKLKSLEEAFTFGCIVQLFAFEKWEYERFY